MYRSGSSVRILEWELRIASSTPPSHSDIKNPNIHNISQRPCIHRNHRATMATSRTEYGCCRCEVRALSRTGMCPGCGHLECRFCPPPVKVIIAQPQSSSGGKNRDEKYVHERYGSQAADNDVLTPRRRDPPPSRSRSKG